MSGALYDDAVGLAVGLAGLPAEAAIELMAKRAAEQPRDAAIRAVLAGWLWAAGRGEEAQQHMAAAAALAPGAPEFGLALSRMLRALGRTAEGEAAWRQALSARRANADLSAARSEALLRLGFVADPAVAEAAARLSGSALLARLRAARVRLEDGALEAAWPDFAWRGRDPDAPGIAARMPYGPLEKPNPTTWRGLRVLCFGELGHGDMIQCLRYVPMVLAAGARVVLELQPGLVRLARSIPGVAAVVGWGEEVPPHDLALPMFHLPWAFGTTLATIPAGVPYLGADAAEIASWRARLAALPGMKLGLVWAGEPRRGSEFEAMDARRSLPLAALAPLGAVADVSLVSLQLGTAAAQIVPSGLALHDWTGELSDFAATAALMEALDLVITVDTAAAHLAGALGRKVWLLNRHDSCWRWLRDREDSPWYPTMRIFRQTAPGEWGPVVQRVAAALQEESGSLLKKRTKKLLTLDAGRLDPSASNE